MCSTMFRVDLQAFVMGMKNLVEGHVVNQVSVDVRWLPKKPTGSGSIAA